MYYRSMNPEKAINLISSFFRFSSRVPRVSAVDNILPKSYFKEVLPYLNTPPEMTLFYEVKADLSEDDVQIRILDPSGNFDRVASFTQAGFRQFLLHRERVDFRNLRAIQAVDFQFEIRSEPLFLLSTFEVGQRLAVG